MLAPHMGTGSCGGAPMLAPHMGTGSCGHHAAGHAEYNMLPARLHMLNTHMTSIRSIITSAPPSCGATPHGHATPHSHAPPEELGDHTSCGTAQSHLPRNCVVKAWIRARGIIASSGSTMVCAVCWGINIRNEPSGCGWQRAEYGRGYENSVVQGTIQNTVG